MSGRRQWWVLIGSCLALFVLMLDSTEVVLALPVIQDDLHVSDPGLQWIQNGYLLMLAATVITCGRLGDILGRSRVFIAGTVVFALGAVVAGAATGEEMLIAARFIQGVGGAAMFALSLAIASNAFPPEKQPTAVGIWAAISSIALGVGPLLGGILVEGVGWRWIFWTYLPFCLAAVVILRLTVDDSGDRQPDQTIDVPGLVTVTAGLGLVVLALVEFEVWGAAAILPLVAGLALLGAFWVIEHRVKNPLVDFGLFRNRPYFGASIAALAIVAAYWTTMFFEPIYLQGSLGYSVIAAGVLILPITAPLMFISPFTGRLLERLGPRRLLVGGVAAAAVGLLGIVLLGGQGSYGAILVPYLVFGVALAAIYAPVSSAAMAVMPREQAGIAAGVLGMQRLLAGALVLAASGAVFQAIDDGPGVSATAVSWALVVPVVVLIAGALGALKLIPPAAHRHEPSIEHHRLHF
jgi:EmrB/QacA subfamily drug resistance transporter